MKKLLKMVGYGLLGVLALFLVLAGGTQTQFFRDRIREAALSRIDSLLIARTHLGNISGNLVTGFSVDGLSIRLKDDTLIVADRLDVRYNLFEAFSRMIAVENLTLVRPRISLFRSRDGVWNFGRMVRPTPEDTTVAGAFDWLVNAGELKIENGSITLVDSSALADPSHERRGKEFVEYHDFLLENFNITISASFSQKQKRAAISSMSFVSNRPDFRLDELSGMFLVTPDSVSIEKLVVQTERSHLELSAKARNIDILSGIALERMQHMPLTLGLHIRNINLGELAGFIPQIAFLNGSAQVDLDVSGEFGQLDIHDLTLRTGTSLLNLSGGLFNLHTPSDLTLDVKFVEGSVSTNDARELMPSLNLPDLHSIGAGRLSGNFVGKPTDFRSTITIETGAGNIQSDVTLRIGGPPGLRYNGVVRAGGLDLGKVLDDQSFASALNGTITAEGEGTSLGSLAAKASVRLDSSEFLGQSIGSSELTLDAHNGRIKGSVNTSLGNMRSNLVGEIDTKSEEFSIQGDVVSLNLEDILRDHRQNSDLTMNVKLDGRGFDWGRLGGEFNLEFTSSSRFRDYRIENGKMSIFLNQQDPSLKELSLESSIADFSLRGAFELDHLVALISYEAENIRNAIGKKFVAVDTAFAINVNAKSLSVAGKRLRKEVKNVDATYSLTLKNIEPLSVVTGNKTFDGTGTLRGAVIGSYESLSIDGRLNVKDFFYGNAESGLLLQNAEASFVVTNLLPNDPLADLELRMAVEAKRLHINRNKLDSVRFSFTYGQGYLSYNAQSVYGNWRAALNGIAEVDSDQVVFTLNGMNVAYKDFAWAADGGGAVGFSARQIAVTDLVLRRDTQTVTASGFIGTEGDLKATVHAHRVDLDNLKYLLAGEERGEEPTTFSGMADLDVTASGLLGNPEYSATLNADNVAFRTVPFGRVHGRATYKNRLSHLDITVDHLESGDQARPDLTISGTLPIDLAITHTGGDTVADGALDLDIRSDGVQMGILDPLLPTFNQLKGVLKCYATITGTMKRPSLAGSLTIDSCSFLFVPNNIFYQFEGKFEPSGERIKVVDAIVRNVPEDRRFGRYGVVHIGGDFSLRELKPTDFDLTATGTLLVVKETTKRSALSVYGNLFVEMGPQGLHFTGTVENSLLQGSVIIRNSALVFPPTQASASRELERAVKVILWDDTSRVTDIEQPYTVETRYFGPTANGDGQINEPTSPALPTKSFLDGVKYELEIETTGGNTEFRMIFNTATGEELLANLEGKFSILEDGTVWVGTVSIDRAYYNFTKRFNAEGTITYSGDFQNPEMNITARYRGTRVVADTTGPDRRENIVVILKITGTRKEPKLDISMTIDDVDYYSYSGPKSSDVNSDAIQYLITGNFPLTESQKNDIAAELRSTVGTSLVTGATSLLSNTLSEFLRRETGFINSIEIGYGTEGGSFGESADIRLSGVAFNGLWRYGGRLLDDPLSNANVSILYSFGDILNKRTLRNFMFELERRVETSFGQVTDKREINSARLFYRFSF